MKSSSFTYKDQDGIDIFVYKWEPDNGQVKACVQFSHGQAEHALRYQYFAEFLTKNGFVCYGDDHRGHGKSVKDDHKGYLGPNGWNGTVNAIHELTKIIKKEFPDKPLFLFAHSWGSFMGQDVIQQWGSDYKGCVLSGTMGSNSKLLLKIAGIMARRGAKKSATAPNQRLDGLAIKPLNKRWSKEPDATGFEWLSRDKNQVKKYIEDPFCGFVMPSSYFVELGNGLMKIWKKSNEKNISKDLPIFFIAGELDPVGKETKTVKQLSKRYRFYGISDIKEKYYPEGRHEMLNELNKEEVYNDILTWFNKHL